MCSEAHRLDRGVIEPGSDEELELRGVWLSRRMFGWMVGLPEHRTYEEWLAALGLSLE